jgi:hypothetical protein
MAEGESSIAADIAQNHAKAELLRRQVDERGTAIDGYAKEYLFRESELRRQLNAVLHRAGGSVSEYVLPEQRPLEQQLREQRVPLLPRDDELSFKDVPPMLAEPACKDTLASVLVAVVADALELREVTVLLIAAIESTPYLQEKAEEFSRAAGVGDWKRAIAVAVEMFKHLLKREFLDHFVKVVGGEKALALYKALLRKSAALFVPFEGEVYAGIILGVAIYRNSDRLLAYVRCSMK